MFITYLPSHFLLKYILYFRITLIYLQYITTIYINILEFIYKQIIYKQIIYEPNYI